MLALGLLCVRPVVPQAQQNPVHLNPMIAKLAEGKPVFGVSASDFSLEIAHTVSRSGVDFVRIDMEHGPMDFETLRDFLVGMIDKAAILKKGNAQVDVAPIARFAPYGRDSADWVPKQALDAGLMGVIFNDISNEEQALHAVRNMRYPQLRTSKHFTPEGLRGVGPGNALWFWGIGAEEYNRRVDLWPLNPQGDLLAIMMIESVEGLKNVDAIAAVPGVGMLFPGGGADLANSMGISFGSPEREAALQRILKSCKDHNIACGVTADASDVQKRVREGWKYLDLGRVGGITAASDAALRAGRAVVN